MNGKLNRRSFLSLSGAGIGTVDFSNLFSPVIKGNLTKKSFNTGGMKLIATTDYNCNIGKCNCFFDRSQLDDMHKYLSSIGVTRHQWIMDTYWNLYETNHYTRMNKNGRIEGSPELKELVK